MAYVSVKQNELGEWEILKYLSSVINQVSPLTGYTIGNISNLDAAGRLLHGFWIMNDVYVGTGEFMEFDKKETVLDDVECIVTNTYTYKRMDLAIIREEMKNRVRGYRMQLSSGLYKKGDHEYDMSTDGRCELHGFIIESLIDSSIEMVSIRLLSGVDVTLSVLELKELYLEIASYRDGLFDKEAHLIDAIDAAQDYEAIRLAAHWDEQEL